MADELEKIVHTHLLECANNYAELHAVTEAQNVKIDALARNVETLTTVMLASVGWLIVTLTAASGFLLKHNFF
jgi:hypothetical protein